MLSNKFSISSGTLVIVHNRFIVNSPTAMVILLSTNDMFNALINVSTLLHFLLATTTIYYCRVL